jgi:hypothetical protein
VITALKKGDFWGDFLDHRASVKINRGHLGNSGGGSNFFYPQAHEEQREGKEEAITRVVISFARAHEDQRW